MKGLRSAGVILATAIVSAVTDAASIPAPSCPGDCDRDGSVDVAELIAGVNSALGRSTVCPELDRNSDGRLSVDELVVAVDNAVGGCFPACEDDLDQETVDQLVFETVFGKVELQPGRQTTLRLGVIECCVFVEPVDACLSWSVEPQAGATIDRRGVLRIAPSVEAGRVFTVTADVEMGRRLLSTQAHVYTPAANPFVGYWREDVEYPCDGGAPIVPDPRIQEVLFHADGTFSVTWFPFEVYIDYWGTYDFDLTTGRFELIATGGNFIPSDIDGSGTFRVDAEGGLRLDGIWLGRRTETTNAACGHRLIR